MEEGAATIYAKVPLLNSRDIRVVDILVNEDFESEVKCKMRVISLNDERYRYYQTLSYAWGTLAKSRMIWIDDTPMLVTVDLYYALKRLREKITPAGGAYDRTIWVTLSASIRLTILRKADRLR